MILINQPALTRGQAQRNAFPEMDVSAHDANLRVLCSLEERIKAIVAVVPGRVAFSSSLGIENQAITHAIAETKTPIKILTLDTGQHFPETYDTLFETEARYGMKIRVLYPDAKEVEELVETDGIYGFRYSVDSRKSCCDIRKVRPLNRALNGAGGWVTGLRREQSQGRAEVPFAAYDRVQGLLKLNPIADWTQARLEDYVTRNKILVNTLHARGFPSIGCRPCTRAIKPGEDTRAGRWWWENENGKKCGLHSHSKDIER